MPIARRLNAFISAMAIVRSEISASEKSAFGAFPCVEQLADTPTRELVELALRDTGITERRRMFVETECATIDLRDA